MRDLRSQFIEAKNAYYAGRFSTAKKILDQLIFSAPISLEGLGARFLRARGYEDGLFGITDLSYAMDDYTYLVEAESFFYSDGLVGRARILFKIDPNDNYEIAAKLATQAINKDPKNSEAMIFLGSVHEAHKIDDLAAKYYISAFKAGSPWGLRYYARLKTKRGDYIIGFASHFLTTLISPFLYFLHRARSPLK